MANFGGNSADFSHVRNNQLCCKTIVARDNDPIDGC